MAYLGGYLARDPELRYISTGTALCSFAIAHSRSYKRGDTWEKEVSYVDVKAWGTTAERAAALNKGAEVVASGRLVQERWQAADGSQRSRLTLIADKIDTVSAPMAKATRDDDLPF